MSTKFTKTMAIVLVLVGTFMIATMAEAKKTKMTFSGWSVATEIDTTGLGPDGIPDRIPDGITGTSETYEGSGTFGKSTSNNQSETVFIGFCGPNILQLQYVACSVVTRYSNGDLLFSSLDENPLNPSTICYNFVDLTYTITIHLVIWGGTGRFEGATGSSTATVTGTGLASEPDRLTHSAFWGLTEGEIFLSGD